jgi:hypothetical protein
MPNAAFSYNIALVYQAMGDKRSALRWLRGYLRQTDKKDDLATIEKVRGLEAELQSRGIQQVTVLSNPAGATLRIDGNALGITPFTLEMAPGSHQASLTLDGYQPAQQAFELRPDRSMDLDIVMTPAVQTSSPVSAAPQSLGPVNASAPTIVQNVAPPSDLTRPSARVRPLTWVSLGVGTALFGGAVVFELKREKDEKDARSASQLDYQTTYDRMHSAQTAARVLAVAGTVVLTTGVVLLTVDLTHKGSTQSAYVASCGPQGICAALRGQF